MKRQNLKLFRKSQGLTQNEMAIKLGISTSHYKGVELGRYNPSYKVISRFQEQFPSENAWVLFNNEDVSKSQ